LLLYKYNRERPHDKMHPDEFDENTWKVIDKFFKSNRGYQLTKHQIESFNDFILKKLDQIIIGFNPIEIFNQYVPEHDKFRHVLQIELKNPVLNKPIINEKDGSTKLMTPNDSRQRSFTYSSNLNIDVHITAKTLNIDPEDENNGEYLVETKTINAATTMGVTS